jgi:hypothetical protein
MSIASNNGIMCSNVRHWVVSISSSCNACVILAVVVCKIELQNCLADKIRLRTFLDSCNEAQIAFAAAESALVWRCIDASHIDNNSFIFTPPPTFSKNCRTSVVEF